MVQYFKKLDGIKALLGRGTTRILPYMLKTRPGGQVELASCVPTKIGTEPQGKTFGPKIVLEFQNVESLNVLIEKLQDLREDMINADGTQDVQDKGY